MKWVVSGYRLDVNLPDLADGLAVGKRKREKSMLIPKVLAWISQSVVIGLMELLTKMGRLEWKHLGWVVVAILMVKFVYLLKTWICPTVSTPSNTKDDDNACNISNIKPFPRPCVFSRRF